MTCMSCFNSVNAIRYCILNCFSYSMYFYVLLFYHRIACGEKIERYRRLQEDHGGFGTTTVERITTGTVMELT